MIKLFKKLHIPFFFVSGVSSPSASNPSIHGVSVNHVTKSSK